MSYISPIEFSGIVQRTNDISTMKQNEDAKPMVDQNNFSQAVHKHTEHVTQEVANKDNADGRNEKFDAKEKGKNKYARQGGKKKKAQEGDKVVVKGVSSGFDIQI